MVRIVGCEYHQPERSRTAEPRNVEVEPQKCRRRITFAFCAFLALRIWVRLASAGRAYATIFAHAPHSQLLENAVDQLATLPGIGRRTAMRYALELLRREPRGGAASGGGDPRAERQRALLQGVLQHQRQRGVRHLP